MQKTTLFRWCHLSGPSHLSARDDIIPHQPSDLSGSSASNMRFGSAGGFVCDYMTDICHMAFIIRLDSATTFMYCDHIGTCRHHRIYIYICRGPEKPSCANSPERALCFHQTVEFIYFKNITCQIRRWIYTSLLSDRVVAEDQ